VVDTELAGLNPVDISIASGAVHAGAPQLPTAVGLEGVGRVDGGPLCYFGGATAPVPRPQTGRPPVTAPLGRSATPPAGP